jgi:hypothetical protein
VNTQAIIVPFADYEVIGYYTIQSEEKPTSEADDFFIRMESIKEIEDELQQFVYWMVLVGNEMGVTERTFRHEGLCRALPPVHNLTHDAINLRLYCHIISNNVVILFNGDRKTAGAIKAQDCPRIRPHHSRATGWANKLLKEDIETSSRAITNIDEISIIY